MNSVSEVDRPAQKGIGKSTEERDRLLATAQTGKALRYELGDQLNKEKLRRRLRALVYAHGYQLHNVMHDDHLIVWVEKRKDNE